MGGTLWMKAEIFMNSSKISVEKPADFVSNSSCENSEETPFGILKEFLLEL